MKPWDPSTFPRARRQKAIRRIAGRLSGEDTEELLPLDEVTRRLGVFDQRYIGVRPIPLERIVGTVDRTTDYDRDFLPRRSDIGERWRSLERSVRPESFPPIVVYQVADNYFVVDGHHRVALAKQLGMGHLDAEITLLRTRFPVPEGADVARIIHQEQQGRFLEESGLARARPEANIELTRAMGYLELLEQVKVHGYHLMQERGAVLSPEEIAADWYDRVYLPTVDAIHRLGLAELFPKTPEADLFLWVQGRRRELTPERGVRSLESDVVDLVAAEQARRRRGIRRAMGTRPTSRLIP